MAITYAGCLYQMPKKSAICYFYPEFYLLFKWLYQYYQQRNRSFIDGNFCYFLHQKQVICPNCLKYCGWIDKE